MNLGRKSVVYFQTRCLNCFLIYGPMLTKRKKKCQKSKILNFANLSTTLVETLPRVAWIWGSDCGMYFQRSWCLKFFLPYDPMSTKTKKQSWKKTTQTNAKILKNKWSENMVKRYLSIKFWHESAWLVLRKRVLQMTDDRVTTVALLCSSTKADKAELKIMQKCWYFQEQHQSRVYDRLVFFFFVSVFFSLSLFLVHSLLAR